MYGPSDHYYTKYVGDHTQLWIFGEGLGERAMITQLGECFLSLCDSGEDPHLGRVMMCLGEGQAVKEAYRGDYNLNWVWDITPEDVVPPLREHHVRPSLILSHSRQLCRSLEELGYQAMTANCGINPRTFKPLNLPRSGLGYAGIDNKSVEQQRIVLQPAIDHGDFEWINKSQLNVKYPDLPDYNRWLNTKRITFGMISENRQGEGFISSRVFECLGSGTPLISYAMVGFKELVGFELPYQTRSPEETKTHIEYILNHYDAAQKQVAKLSERVREEQSYDVKLRAIFNRLRELKR